MFNSPGSSLLCRSKCSKTCTQGESKESGHSFISEKKEKIKNLNTPACKGWRGLCFSLCPEHNYHLQSQNFLMGKWFFRISKKTGIVSGTNWCNYICNISCAAKVKQKKLQQQQLRTLPVIWCVQCDVPGAEHSMSVFKNITLIQYDSFQDGGHVLDTDIDPTPIIC